MYDIDRMKEFQFNFTFKKTNRNHLKFCQQTNAKWNKNLYENWGFYIKVFRFSQCLNLSNVVREKLKVYERWTSLRDMIETAFVVHDKFFILLNCWTSSQSLSSIKRKKNIIYVLKFIWRIARWKDMTDIWIHSYSYVRIEITNNHPINYGRRLYISDRHIMAFSLYLSFLIY